MRKVIPTFLNRSETVIPIRSETIEAESYCWRPDRVARYESLWMLLQKFGYWNAGTAEGIYEGLGVPPLKTDWWRWNDTDLRFFGHHLDASKMAIAFRLTESRLHEAVVASFVKDREVRVLGCNTLRFCLSCLQTGFHSALHQLLFLDKCPVHLEKFLTHCVACLNVIPYQFDRKSFRKPLSCPTCHIVLCPELLQNDTPPKSFLEKRDVKHSLYCDWLMTRVRASTNDRVIEAASAKESTVIPKLCRYWARVFPPERELGQLLAKVGTATQDVHARSLSNIQQSDRKVDLLDPKWDMTLYRIFKSISRHLLKTTLSGHRRCIERDGPRLWWDKYALSYDQSICEAVNAFILWRMYFEAVDHPIKLFKKHKDNVFQRFHISRRRPDGCECTESLAEKIFALECYWVFYECQLLARKFREEKCYSFNLSYITGRTIPHWITRSHREQKLVEFNYWIDPYWINDRLKVAPHCGHHEKVKANLSGFV